MLWKGAREQGVDYFDEYGEDGVDTGVFTGAGGAQAFESKKQRMYPDGLRVELQCRSCGAPGVVTVDLFELFVISLNGPGRPPKFPPNWVYSPNFQTLFTQMRCGRCGAPKPEAQHGGFPVHVKPDEARDCIKQALHAGSVTQQQLQMWAQQLGIGQPQAR